MVRKGVTVWFTGLSGAGKSTISLKVKEELCGRGCSTVVLDGDCVRRTLTKDLGFSRNDREKNLHLIGFLAYLLTRCNIIVLVSVISPYREIRDYLRRQIGDFIEVYVDAPLEVCEKRDVKGLYKMARAGIIKDFTGIDSPYENPLNPEVKCLTDQESVDKSSEKVLNELICRGYIN
ncbi:MAG: adenylyl-sulfate kinase [Bacillota bacterium]